MSERGSFVTEYIYCSKCLEAVKLTLLGNEKYLCSQQIRSWESDRTHLPIIAGKLGGLYAGEEVHLLLQTLREAKQKPCHDITIAVITDGAETVHRITWEGKRDHG